MATSSLLIYEVLEIEAFRIFSMILSITVIVLWCYTFTRTMMGVWTGTIL
jgi:tellurite resistance protein TehA-like permease